MAEETTPEVTSEIVDVEPHATETSLIKVMPQEIEADAALTITVGVVCESESCDLRGGTVMFVAEDGSVLGEVDLAEYNGVLNKAVATGIMAPAEPGHYTWEVVFPAQTLGDGSPHQESKATFSFEAKTHTTSMAVWDVPTPTAVGIHFTAKVGVRCPQQCNLAGSEVEVYDELGAKVGAGMLTDSPWPSTEALYWADVNLQAPAAKGSYEWVAKIQPFEAPVAHEGCVHTFAFTTADAPEHMVTVVATRRDTAEAVPDAEVMMMATGGFPYRARCDEMGTARLHVPKGEYTVHAVQYEYVAFEMPLSVGDDALVKAEMEYKPDPYK